MAKLYIPASDAEKKIKLPEQNQIVQAVEEKTYTQEEVLAMLAQVQKGEQK